MSPTYYLFYLSFYLLTNVIFCQVQLKQNWKPEQPAKGSKRLLFLVGNDLSIYNLSIPKHPPNYSPFSKIVCGYKTTPKGRTLLSPCQVSTAKGIQSIMVQCGNSRNQSNFAILEFLGSELPDYQTNGFIWVGFSSDSAEKPLQRTIGNYFRQGNDKHDDMIVNCYNNKRF